MHDKHSLNAVISLEGRTAFVTGAGSGIGKASAATLAAAGATVYCADVLADTALATAAEITELGGSAIGLGLDIASRSAVNDAVARAIDETGRLDIACNIAGKMSESKVLDITEDDLDQMLNINLRGALFVSQAAGRHMVDNGGGSIINMASTAVLAPSPDIAVYAMTKAALVQMTKTMSVEVGKFGVRVNAIAPGFVPTKMTSRYYTNPDGTEDAAMKEMVLAPMAKFAPLRRVGTTDDIAHAVLYLASDLSSFVTGQLLAPNGGVAGVS
jgi:3-oxoacyl-[acyl-carrier protein] reductase